MFSPFFHIKENPFGETPNVGYFYKSQTHYEALIHLFTGVNSGKGMHLVVGEVGTGKTLLCRLFMKVAEQRGCRTALILQPIFEPRDLLSHIGDEFGAPKGATSNASLKEELDRLQNFFLDSARLGKRCLLLIDEAHKLSFESLETIRLLTNLETDREKIAQVIFFAQPELSLKLDSYQARQIRQRLVKGATLEPFSLNETEAYVKHRLSLSGAENFVRFNSDALRTLHKHSGGIPRLINFYAEMALARSESLQVRLITGKLVKAVAQTSESRSQPGFLHSLLDFGKW